MIFFEAFFNHLSDVIPWIKEVDLKTMHKHIPKILDTLERVTGVFKKIIEVEKKSPILVWICSL